MIQRSFVFFWVIKYFIKWVLLLGSLTVSIQKKKTLHKWFVLFRFYMTLQFALLFSFGVCFSGSKVFLPTFSFLTKMGQSINQHTLKKLERLKQKVVFLFCPDQLKKFIKNKRWNFVFGLSGVTENHFSFFHTQFTHNHAYALTIKWQ